MAKASKKKAVKKSSKNSNKWLPKGYAVHEIKNQFVEPFEIEVNPPLVGRGDKYAWEIFKGRVEATLSKLQPGQAFNVTEKHSKAWIRDQLNKHFPERKFVIVGIPDNENGYRIYLKA